MFLFAQKRECLELFFWPVESDSIVTLDSFRLYSWWLLPEDHWIFRVFLCAEKYKLSIETIDLSRGCFLWQLPGPEAGKDYMIPRGQVRGVYKGSGHCFVLPAETSIELFPRSSCFWYFVSLILTTSLMIISWHIFHHQPFHFRHLLLSPFPGFYKLCFSVLTFYSLSIGLGLAISTLWPSNLSVSGWGIIPSSYHSWKKRNCLRKQNF